MCGGLSSLIASRTSGRTAAVLRGVEAAIGSADEGFGVEDEEIGSVDKMLGGKSNCRISEGELEEQMEGEEDAEAVFDLRLAKSRSEGI